MKKKLVLEFDRHVNDEVKRWAMEAVQDFVDLFPEFKENFEINQNKSFYTSQEIEDIILQHGMPRNAVSSFFERQSDGTYLRKDSIDYLQGKLIDNGRLNHQEYLNARHPVGSKIKASDPICISISSLPSTFGKGISNFADILVSVPECQRNKDYFKDILMHELGHAFNATHEGRNDCSDVYGMHCNDPNCLMYVESYTPASFNRRHSQKRDSPFCDKCMESMRNFMVRNLDFTRSKDEQSSYQPVQVSNEPLIEEHTGTDRTFKKALREVFRESARKEDAVYKEDISANNYVAKVTHKDGSVDHISASSATNLSLSGKDKDGNPKVPDMQRFRDIAEYTHSKNTFVNFGNIKTPEFKAKLMLACMEHKPPVAMRGQPEVNKEFLDSLTDAAVKKMLEDAINKGKKKDPQQQSTIINQNILYAQGQRSGRG